GASQGAARVGLSPLVVGLTVVAFGTSAPEVAISLLAVHQGQSDLALGNVVGSNIFNVLLILGVAALVAPLVVDRKLVRFDVPILVAASALVLVMALDGEVSSLEGGVLLGGLAAYLLYTLRQARPEPVAAATKPSRETAPAPPPSLAKSGVLFVVGLGLLVGGAQLLVTGGAGLARAAGLSELIVGLTILAAGTSIPEVATSVVAAWRGQRDIAVGNAIGSSLFNLLFVLGAAALLSTGVPVPNGALHFDLPVMLATAVAALPIFFTGYRVDRWEGAVLVGYYAAYLAYLILDATGHDAAVPFGRAMLMFVVPLTALTLLGIVLAARRQTSQPLRPDTEASS
ncbi:MAG: calcium/sodium antiporter, partial [Deltaproteobacteria bacterium]|nr:calcium/sodium antiporter [Deltaproteobacteria bacterium]MBW2533303.1 calcium/sodium antiporter [Deltaproteobacteria bacterium]